MTLKLPQVFVKAERTASIHKRHPWLFSGSIDRSDAEIKPGDLVSVYAPNAELLGTGFYEGGNIAVKLLSFAGQELEGDFIARRLRAAVKLRQSSGLFSRSDTDSFRLAFGEGDDLPGLVVDLFGTTAVIEFHSLGMLKHRAAVVEAIREVLGERVKLIYGRTDSSLVEEKLVDRRDVLEEVLWSNGQSADEDLIISENGRRFAISLSSGQKTGFFLDQRENRLKLSALSEGRDVLDCFCYSGAFGVYALTAGARSCHFVDSSKRALTLAEKNVGLNPHTAGSVTFQEEDGLRFLKDIKDRFDCIVLDPPAFVKHRAALTGGLKGYETINRLAFEQIRPGGMVLTFSCSQAVDNALFREVIAKAALRAKRFVQIVGVLTQPACHPVSVHLPEGEYLKGLLLHVQ